MASSNIIKLHHLRPTVVVIGRRENACLNPSLENEVRVAILPEPNQAAAVEAEEIIAKARQDAEAIVNAAIAQAEQLKAEAVEKGLEKGFEKGYADGTESARSELEGAVQAIAGLVKEATIERGSLLQAAESELVQLALAIAEKVVHKQLAEDKSLVVSLARGALEYVDAVDVIRIRVNPVDLQVLQACWDEFGLTHSSHVVELASDPRVQVGGCIIDTKSAVVDAQVETQLAEIERALRAELETDEKR